MASGEISKSEFIEFLTKTFSNLARVSTDGAIHFQCMDWRHGGEILAAGDAAYTELKNICVWARTTAAWGPSIDRPTSSSPFSSPERRRTSTMSSSARTALPHQFLVLSGREQLRPQPDDDLAMHPTVTPVAMIADPILDCSRRKDIVLDRFAGSGSRLLAAQRTGRRGYGSRSILTAAI
jgi:hypothetical protein